MTQTPINKPSENIKAVLDAMIQPEQVVELRILGVDGKKKRTDSGFFNDMNALAKAAARYIGKGQIYITPNPVAPDLLAKANNRVREWVESGDTTNDLQICRRHWFLIDADPDRISGISSTDAEHDAALARIRTVVTYLTGRAWPKPIEADSGNGGHADYFIDLPNTPESTLLIQRCLLALSMQFNDERVKIDTSVFNAARIWKLYGTKAIKGDHTEDRPHRYAQIVSKPDELKPVTLGQLQALAALAPDTTQTKDNSQASTNGVFNIETWMKSHDITGHKAAWNGGQRWRLDKCYFSEAHTDGAYIVQMPSGAIAAGCSHNTCQGKTWQDLRTIFDGTAEERKRKWIEQKEAERLEDDGVTQAFVFANSQAQNDKTFVTNKDASGENQAADSSTTDENKPTDNLLLIDEILTALEELAKNAELSPEQRKAKIARELATSIGRLDRAVHVEIEGALAAAQAGFSATKAAKFIKDCASDEKKRTKETKRQITQQRQAALLTNRVWIETGNQQLRDIVKEGIAVLLDHNKQNPTEPAIYVRGGIPARIVKDELGKRTTQPVNRAGGKILLSMLADWGKTRVNEETGEIERTAEYPPNDVVDSILNLGEWPMFPGVENIVNAPVFGRNGILHCEPGYNPETKLYYSGGVTVGDYTATPENIAKAKKLILDKMMGEFPFVDEASKAHAVAYLILPSVRQLIPGPTPAHNFNSPTEGTGKSLLQESCAIVPLGEEPSTSKQLDSDDEYRKAITSFLMTGQTHYVIDNVNKPLDSGVLASAITQPIWSDRALGSNHQVSLPMRAIWAITANNLAVSGEMARRCVSIRLDANLEKPWERTFEIDNLKTWVKENRNELVTAVCTLVQAWLDAGRPKFVGRQKGSFTDWANTIGGILQTVGIPGFLDNEDEMHDQSINTTALIADFIKRWFALYQRNPVSASQLFQLASFSDIEGENPLGGWENLLGPELLGAGNQRSRQTRLGTLLTKQRDRVVADHKIRYDHASNGQKYWRLDPAKEPVKYTVEPLIEIVEPSKGSTQGSTQNKQGSTQGSTQDLASRQVRNSDLGSKTHEIVEPVEPFSNLTIHYGTEKTSHNQSEQNSNNFSDLYRGLGVEGSTGSTNSTFIPKTAEEILLSGHVDGEVTTWTL